jgi:hypothetical protein
VPQFNQPQIADTANVALTEPIPNPSTVSGARSISVNWLSQYGIKNSLQDNTEQEFCDKRKLTKSMSLDPSVVADAVRPKVKTGKASEIFDWLSNKPVPALICQLTKS